MAAAAIVAAQSSQKSGGSFLDDLTSKNTQREQLIVRELTRKYGFAWREFGTRPRARAMLQDRIESTASQIEGGEAESPWSRDLGQERDGSIGKTTGQGEAVTTTVDQAPQPLDSEEPAPDSTDAGTHPIQKRFPLLSQLDPALFVELDRLEAHQQALDGIGQGRAELPIKQKIDLLLNDPDSSAWALRISVIVLVTICVSCVAILIESLPEFANNNDTADTVFFVIDTFCVAIFTVEFIARFWSCPVKTRFVKQPMNVSSQGTKYMLHTKY